MNDVKAMIRFIMEDLMDFRRRLPYADYLEGIGCHKAAARQREFVTMCERAQKIDEWSGMLRITTKSGKVIMIFKKNGNVNPMNTGSKEMCQDRHISSCRKRINKTIIQGRHSL